MSEATGQPAAGQTTGSGSTLLTEAVGNPQGAELDKSQLTTVQATNGTQNATPSGRPDYFPEKFWKGDKPDHEGLARSYLNLEKLLTSEKVPKPTRDEDTEAWDRWYKAAGRPEDGKGYEFKKPDKLPDGFYDDTAEQSFRDWAFNNGLNKRQAANLHEAYVKTQLDRHSAYQTQTEQQKSRLKADLIREHGAAFEGFSKGASAAMTKFADPDFVKFLDETGHGNDPRMIRVFGRIGKAMMGDTALRGQPPQEVNTADLDKQISDYRAKYGVNDKGKIGGALYDKMHPDHEQRVREFNKLFALRYPEPPK